MFVIIDNEWSIDPQYLTITCIYEVWKRDKAKDKATAKAQIGWLYHMHHPKSTYRDMRDSQRNISVILATFPKAAQAWDIETDPIMKVAEAWYKEKLSNTPIWDTVRAIEQSVYQLNDILRDSKASAYEKKSALETVSNDVQPKLRKLKEQAERDEIIDIKVKGDKDIKSLEKIENASRGVKAPPGAKYKGMVPENHDFEGDLKSPEPIIE